MLEKSNLHERERVSGAQDGCPASASLVLNVAKPNLIKGAVMRVKNWFRGAKDADPGIERQEVDLAQAIIDLHKIDPN